MLAQAYVLTIQPSYVQRGTITRATKPYHLETRILVNFAHRGVCVKTPPRRQLPDDAL